jgi:hypothetical protein
MQLMRQKSKLWATLKSQHLETRPSRIHVADKMHALVAISSDDPETQHSETAGGFTETELSQRINRVHNSVTIYGYALEYDQWMDRASRRRVLPLLCRCLDNWAAFWQ